MKNLQHHKCDLYISALEPSGDLHGAEILKQLYSYALNIHGAGGPKMRKQGLHCHFYAEDFNIMGFVDVLRSLPKLMRSFKQVKQTILRLNPKVVFLIDYPGFHLKLAAALRKSGYQGRIVQYVCPSVWAWKKNRIQTIADNFDTLLTLFPFEPSYFESLPIKAQFVGHPLVKTISPRSLHTSKEDNLIAIFPGSREREIVRNLPKQLQACHAIKKLHPTVKVVISLADDALAPLVEKYNKGQFQVVPHEKNHWLMERASLAVATSGTVTLELALHGVPTIVTYGLSRVDQFIATKVFGIDLPYYCIVNIVLNKELYPELIGTNFTPYSLLKSLEELIENRPPSTEFQELKTKLSNKDAPVESCAEIMRML